MQCEPLNSSSDIIVRPVKTRKELRRFITLPRSLYQGMEGYVPSFDLEQADLLDPKKAAIFRHAEIQYFIAWRYGKPVGRIAAILDHLAISHWQEKIGQFGALDALPEKEIIFALLHAAETWLRKHQVARCRGPVTLSGNAETGMMIKGQKEPLMIAMPWHPPQLDGFIREAGYQKTEDLYAYRLDLTEDLEEKFPLPKGMKLGEGRFKSISLRNLSKKEIVQQGEILRTLYNDAWSQKYNFVPMQEYEMLAMIKQIKLLLLPEHYVQIDQDNQPVAMAMILPNLYDITHDLNGDPSPLGWARFAHRLLTHKFVSARVILLGVSKKLHGTVMGALLPSLAIAEMMRRMKNLPYQWIEMGWIQQSDKGMRSLAESLVPEPYKTYRLYEKNLSEK